MHQDGIWLSVLDYANVKKTSISTIRRSIKAGHVKFREENGKYFIWTKEIKNHLNKSNTPIPNTPMPNTPMPKENDQEDLVHLFPQ